MNSRILPAVVALLLPVCAGAQTTDAATRELIARLLARIDSLEKRVSDLEKEKTTAAVAAQPAAPPTAPPPAEHMHEQAPVAEAGVPEAAQPVYPSLKIAGFADVDFGATDLHGANGGFGAQSLLLPHSGFALGQTTLHFTSALAPKVSVFGEITFSARADGGTGSPPATGFNAEVERILVRYDLNDYFKISFGRYHTPINYWNTAFHHGQWLQTTISRPEMTQFGGSFIPVHFIGTLVEGSTPAGGLNLNYNFGVGNGRGQVISRGGDAGDINNNRAWLFNGFIKPNRPFGLQLGGSVYRDEINPLTGPVSREWIQSAHVVWHKENPELIAEFANVTHKPIFSSETWNSQAWYAQIAYRLPGAGRL
jgi:hypothetical protein